MRNEVLNRVLGEKSPNILLELPTGMGKSKIAIKWAEHNNYKNVLIVVPRLVLIDNWKAELKKWDSNLEVEFITYISFFKLNIDIFNHDAIIFDEGHHLSERCLDKLEYFSKIPSIILSATMKKDTILRLKSIYYKNDSFKKINIDIRNAINNNVLPDPKVLLIPLYLNGKDKNQEIIMNPKCKEFIVIDIKELKNFRKLKNKKIIIRCTQKEYYEYISRQINNEKNLNYISFHQKRWLQLSGQRLKWLSNQKTILCKTLLFLLQEERTLTFCNSINQSEELGSNSINSKNKDSENILQNFNNGIINHITAVDILNEGCNLTDCRIGLYASLHSSDRLILQQAGRLLRHNNPIFIIPYFKNTRDEEIVKKMCINYNSNLINIIHTKKELIEQL